MLRYLLLLAAGGYVFCRLSFWGFIGAVFAVMFLLAAVLGLFYRDPCR